MTVASKRIRVSDDSGVNWYTLPGNTGNVQDNSGSVDDTVFGQNYKSSQPTLIDGKITANAMYRGYAGYVTTIKKTGTSTPTTGEATTLVTTRVYQVTNTAKQVMDPATAVIVKDGGVDHTADVLSIDYLNAIVTFKGTYTVGGAVTIDYSYLPLTAIAKANSYTLTMSADATDTSDYATMQANIGHKTFQQGLKTVSMDVKGFYAVANGFEALLDGRTTLVIEVGPDGASHSVARGFFKPAENQKSGNVGAIEMYDLKFNLTVPDLSLMVAPFVWTHSSSLLSLAVIKALTAYLAGSSIGVQYLPDGTNGFAAATCFVTDMSMSGSVDGINTFATTFQISGQQTSVP